MYIRVLRQRLAEPRRSHSSAEITCSQGFCRRTAWRPPQLFGEYALSVPEHGAESSALFVSRIGSRIGPPVSLQSTFFDRRIGDGFPRDNVPLSDWRTATCPSASLSPCFGPDASPIL